MAQKRQLPLVWLMDPLCFTPWYTAALAQGLMQQGARVRLISSPFLREPDYFASVALKPNQGLLNLSRFTGSRSRLFQRAFRVSETIINMRSLLYVLRKGRTEQPSILHLQQLPLLNRGFRLDFKIIDAARNLGVPVVHTVHNLLPHDTGNRLYDTYAELYRKVDHLICHSQHAQQRLVEDFKITESRISIIPHGPLFERKLPSTVADQIASRTRLGLPLDRPIVLWQGILAPYKGLDTLLDAWKICVASFSDTDGPCPLLLIAGSGSARLEAQVRRSAESSGGNVRADLLYIASAQLPHYFLAADILTYPYHSITTSGALLTGLSYGKPIVASRLAAFQEYLKHNVNAVLVDPQDPVALAATLHALLRDLMGDDEDHHASANSGTWATLHSGAAENRARYVGWPEIARHTVALYGDLTSTRLA